MKWFSRPAAPADAAAKQPIEVRASAPSDAARALHQQGNSALAQGQLEAAEQAYRAAIALWPGQASYHLCLGVALYEQGQRAEATAALRAAEALDAQLADAAYVLGCIAADEGQLELAKTQFRAALARRPRFTEALERLIALLRAHDSVHVLPVLEGLIAEDAQWPAAQFHYGVAAVSAGDTTRGITALRQALALAAEFGLEPAYYRLSLSDALLHVGQAEAALDVVDPLCAQQPELALAWLQRARILSALGQTHEALAAAQRAASLDPQSAATHYQVGRLGSLAGQHASARLALERALELAPEHHDARYQLAVVCLALGRPTDAAALLHQLVRNDPQRPFIFGQCALGLWSDLDWRDHAALIDEACQRIARGAPAAQPMDLLLCTDAPELQLQCARLVAQPATPPMVTRAYGRHAKIRLAYLSPDFRHHAVSFLLAGVIEGHDRAHFEVFGVGWGRYPDEPVGQRMRAAFDHYLDADQLSDAQIAEWMQAQEIDLAIDLAGLTRDARPGIFARHAAAVQINYLGFPATMGAPYMDYMIADAYVIPERVRRYYAEQLVLMPHCFQANDSQRWKPEGRTTRAQRQLPDDRFIFCCLHSSAKINPQLFDCWMGILQQVQDSVLLMLGNSPVARENIVREAAARGINAERLLLTADMDYHRLLETLSLADLGLDTLPFNGGTSVSDALWSGLPVLTCSGRAMAARMGGSLLQALKLPELITENLADYQALAVRLATSERPRLIALRQRLRAERAQAALFSSRQFCHDIERAYRILWQRSVRGEAPSALDLGT